MNGWALGNTGVAIFFCLSGFLVYTVLDQDRQRYGKISYERYLRRRALRIWPLYFTVVIAALAAIAFYNPQSINAHYIVQFFLFNLNYQMAADHSIWPAYGALAPLWSIGVRSSFILLLPSFYTLIQSRFRWIGAAVIVISARKSAACLFRQRWDVSLPLYVRRPISGRGDPCLSAS